MKEKIIVPPLKMQGIKTKLIPWIKKNLTQYYIDNNIDFNFIDPFMGSGCVGFNLAQKNAVFGDVNPLVIQLYNDIKNGIVTPHSVKLHLEEHGKLLQYNEGSHYYTIRERFNQQNNSHDFIFLNRSCFNGVMRFNQKGGFNTPFCRNPNRFNKSLTTKICNQIQQIQELINNNNWSFTLSDFKNTIANNIDENITNIIYLDPPYIQRHTVYFQNWIEEQEDELFNTIMKYKNLPNVIFCLSTWQSDNVKTNPFIQRYLDNGLHIKTKEHQYFVGAKAENRNKVQEAIIYNIK